MRPNVARDTAELEVGTIQNLCSPLFSPTDVALLAMEDWNRFLPTVSLLARDCKKLTTNCWDVLDECLIPDWAVALASECHQLEEKGLLQPHCFEFAAGDRLEYQHPGRSFVDLEAPRIGPSVAQAAPGLAHFAAVAAPLLAAQLLQEMPQLALTQPPGVQVKLQLTRGTQGTAPCHYDTSETAPRRQVTLLLYLGEKYQDNYGGELVLQPFLESPVKVSPRFNRGVIFLSDRLLHYTLPPTADGTTFARWLLTVWLDGDQVDKATGRWPPLLQRLLAPAIYSKIYLKSLEQSMPPGPALQALKMAQEEEIASIELDDSFAEMLPDLKEAAVPKLQSWTKLQDSPRRGGCKRTWENEQQRCALFDLYFWILLA